MRSFTLIILFFSLLGSTIAIQADSNVPDCAKPCFALAASNSTTCSLTDTTCHCADPNYDLYIQGCTAQLCGSVEDVFTVQNATMNLCGAPIRDRVVPYTILVSVLMGSAVIFVIIRTVYKQFLTQIGLGLDDWAIIAIIFVCIPSSALNIKLGQYGMGKDIWTLTPTQITNFAFTFYLTTFLYFAEVAILKLSLLFFYLRIFPDPVFRRLLWATVVINCLFGVSFILAAIFQCTPVNYAWGQVFDLTRTGGKCNNGNTLAWANAAISIALDLWMLYLPLSQVSGLNLHWKKKIGVAAMVVVGTFVTVVSIVRLASLVEFAKSSNFTYEFFDVSIWSCVEISVGIMCACMPTLRVILIRIWPKVFGTTRGTNRYTNDQYGQSARNPTGNVSQLDNSSSKPRSAVRNTWKPKFAKPGPGFSDRGPFSKSQHTSRLQRIDSNDDATELRPTNYKTQITSSATSGNNSFEEIDPSTITVSRNVEVKILIQRL